LVENLVFSVRSDAADRRRRYDLSGAAAASHSWSAHRRRLIIRPAKTIRLPFYVLNTPINITKIIEPR